MLLSSSSFSNFLDTLSNNPAASTAQTPQLKVEPQQEQRQMPKDINPYNAQQSQQQQIGMAMIPEQNMDFSMLSLDNAYNFQPQVFVVDTPEVPALDAAVLSGKTSNFIEPTFDSEDEKVDMPIIKQPVEKPQVSEPVQAVPIDAEFESDPDFALFHNEPATTTEQPKELDIEGLSSVDIFGGIESDKVLSRLELVDASEEETTATLAMLRVERICASTEAVVSRLELLTLDM